MKISHSAKDTYLTCPYSYYLHYFRKLRTVNEKSSLKFGSSVDIGLNSLLEGKTVETAKEEFINNWNTFKDIELIYSKSDLDNNLLDFANKDNSWASLLQKGQILIEEYNTQIIPRIKKVVCVQPSLDVPNSSGDILVAKSDFICLWETGDIVLFDNKTSSIKYTADSVQTSKQLATYFKVFKDKYNVNKCGYIVLPKTINKKKLPRINISVIVDAVNDELLQNIFPEYKKVLEQIKDAQFPRNEASCINIYGKCNFYDLCKNGSMKGLYEQTV